MNEKLGMTTIYGTAGQPVGSVVGDEIFDADGKYIGFIEDDFIFNGNDGQCFGSYVNGVVYNVYGDAEGFTESAAEGVAQLGPGLSATARQSRSTAPVVRGGECKELPEFFASAQGNRHEKIFV